MSSVGVTPTNRFTRGVQYFAATIRVSIFSVVSTVVASWVLVGLPQGQEILNSITDDQVLPFGGRSEGPIHYGLFLAGLLAWALANWYGSRLLLQRDYMTPLTTAGIVATQGFRVWWNKVFPRLLGACGIGVIAGYMLLFRGQWLAGGGAFAILVLYSWFVIKRRDWFGITGSLMGRPRLSTADRVAVWLSLALVFALVFGLGSINWNLARFLGAPVILFLGLGGLVILGAVVFTYLPLAYGLPHLVWAPVTLAFLLGLTTCNRNHAIAVRLAKGPDLDQSPRPSVIEHFAQWLADHPSGPIVLVAAEGGASRSAWWTSHVLTVLDYASEGEFSKHVYAVSGVSGGSLGAATYVALLAERGEEWVSPEPLRFPTQENCWAMRDHRGSFALPMQSECFLERDVLSTTVGYLLFPDLLQRFLPWRKYTWDRSLGLEESWQNDWRMLFERSSAPEGLVPNPFAGTFESLYVRDEKVRHDIPLLFLNSTRAEAGRSVLQSPVSIPSTELDDLFDSRLHARGLPLSDAVHNSARFPLVSPGGDVETWEHKHWDALVDGGYFENSGAATLAELVRALASCAQDNPSCKLTKSEWDAALPRIQVVFILNDPDNDHSVLPQANERPVAQFPASKPLKEEELQTPLAGLYNPRSARGDSSKRFLISLLLAQGDNRPVPATEIFLLPHPKNPNAPPSEQKPDEPAMSWYLNPESRIGMWAAVDSESTKICQLVRAVSESHFEACPNIVHQFKVTAHP